VTTSETTNMVHWIDAEKFTAFDNTLVDQRPRHAEFNRDGSLLWVSSEIGGTVTVLDVATRKPVSTVNFKIRGIAHDKIHPVGVTLTSDGRFAFIALGPASHVAVVDTKTYEVIKYILVGRRVWHLALTPEEDMLFATNGVSGDVTAVDVATLEAVKSIKVGRYPWGLPVLPQK
jgi:PQQ-dependent catabolism-associated beta-propeller protein